MKKSKKNLFFNNINESILYSKKDGSIIIFDTLFINIINIIYDIIDIPRIIKQNFYYNFY